MGERQRIWLTKQFITENITINPPTVIIEEQELVMADERALPKGIEMFSDCRKACFTGFTGAESLPAAMPVIAAER